MKTALLFLTLAMPLHATWTLIHANSANLSCSGTTCVATVTSTTAGNFLAVGYFGANNVTITAMSAGGTYVHCPACAVGVAGTGWTDAGYVLSATGGVTSITVTLSGSGGSWATIVSEWHTTSGPVIFDTSASNSDVACTTCAAPALTLSGTNDLVIQIAAATNSMTAISGAYTNPAVFPNGDGWAGALNVTSYSAPNWTQNILGVSNVGGMAFKETAASTETFSSRSPDPVINQSWMGVGVMVYRKRTEYLRMWLRSLPRRRALKWLDSINGAQVLADMMAEEEPVILYEAEMVFA